MSRHFQVLGYLLPGCSTREKIGPKTWVSTFTLAKYPFWGGFLAPLTFVWVPSLLAKRKMLATGVIPPTVACRCRPVWLKTGSTTCRPPSGSKMAQISNFPLFWVFFQTGQLWGENSPRRRGSFFQGHDLDLAI